MATLTTPPIVHHAPRATRRAPHATHAPGLPMAAKDGADSIAEQVPRLSGVSQAALVRGGHQAKHVKHFALTQVRT